MPLGSRPWPTERLTIILKKATFEVWKHSVNSQLFRQLCIGISEKHVREVYEPFNRFDDRGEKADRNVVFAWQSGHRPLQRGTTYGLDGAFPTTLQPQLLHLYEWASTRWHDFLHLPSRITPRPGPKTPSDRLAETPRSQLGRSGSRSLTCQGTTGLLQESSMSVPDRLVCHQTSSTEEQYDTFRSPSPPSSSTQREHSVTNMQRQSWGRGANAHCSGIDLPYLNVGNTSKKPRVQVESAGDQRPPAKRRNMRELSGVEKHHLGSDCTPARQDRSEVDWPVFGNPGVIDSMSALEKQ